MTRKSYIYLCSDANGDTAEAVARATLRQFSPGGIELKRYGNLRQEEEVLRVVKEAAAAGGFIAFTLVQPELHGTLVEEARRHGVKAVDLLGPMMQAYVDAFGGYPLHEPGHSLDESYYRRMEAIEFAVKYDDGKDVRGLALAEVVLIGASRTSKTPLSIFLSHKGIRVANLPLVPEVAPPDELFEKRDRLIVGLTMQPDQLVRIRTERLRTLGLPFSASYAAEERIVEELAFADGIMRRLGCPVIDVSDRAIEETAGLIISLLHENG